MIAAGVCRQRKALNRKGREEKPRRTQRKSFTTEQIWDRIICGWVLWRSKNLLNAKTRREIAKVAKKGRFLVKARH
jgi:hypothetical protein